MTEIELHHQVVRALLRCKTLRMRIGQIVDEAAAAGMNVQDTTTYIGRLADRLEDLEQVRRCLSGVMGEILKIIPPPPGACEVTDKNIIEALDDQPNWKSLPSWSSAAALPTGACFRLSTGTETSYE